MMVELLEEYWLDPNFNVKTLVLNVVALGKIDRHAFEESLKGVQGVISTQTDVTNARLTLHYSPREADPEQLCLAISDLVVQHGK